MPKRPIKKMSLQPGIQPALEIPQFAAGKGLRVSDAQWTMGLPTLIFLLHYSGQETAPSVQYEAVSGDGSIILRDDIMITGSSIPTRVSITFSPDEAPRVSKIRLSVRG